MHFEAEVESGGGTTTGIAVPDDVIGALGGGKRPRVTVRINGESFRTTIGSMRGRAMISISAERRELTGVAAGDRVGVDIERDESERSIDVPAELAAALESDPGARAAFEALSNGRKQRLTIPIERGKSAETRERNVAKAMAALRGD